MPHPQRLIWRYHYLGRIHQPITQHRPQVNPYCLPISRLMQWLRIRPALAPGPERLPRPPLLLPVEIPPDTGKAQEQLLDPLLVKLPRQLGPLRPAQQRIDHHRGL